MIQLHAEYFNAWLATFREKLFVILRVYADESGTNDPTGKEPGSRVPTIGGWIESPEYWTKFWRRWSAILDDYRAPYFHFREFANPKLYNKKSSPYYGWSEKQREGFLYDLALSAGETAVPIGSCYDAKLHYEKGGTGNTCEIAIRLFYKAFFQALDAHWPGFDGQVLFVFDENDNVQKWATPILRAHKAWQAIDGRLGGVSFEDDLRCPPLQAADMYAYSLRQQGERYMIGGHARQQHRALDFILGKNTNPLNRKLMPIRWRRLVKAILDDRKRQKAIWAKQGKPKTEYYPQLHFDFKPWGITV